MDAPGASRWPGWLVPAGWTVLLALLPWWLGVPLLLTLAAILLTDVEWLSPHAFALRRALRWGLPGVLLALLFWLGGDALAWAVALLGGLAGFTLIAGLEAWLDRDRRGASASIDSDSDSDRQAPSEPSAAPWPELALASRAPPATIIELVSPRWSTPDEPLHDPDGRELTFNPGVDGTGTYDVADGRRIDAASAQACFSPDGRWFASHSERGTMLWDRQRDREYRLRRWQLCGWYQDQPWLQRREGAMPVSLTHALGEREERGR